MTVSMNSEEGGGGRVDESGMENEVVDDGVGTCTA